MEAEEFMALLDRCWFEADIFHACYPQERLNSAESVRHGSLLVLSQDQKVLVRSMSDQLASQGSFSPSGLASPDSVLLSRRGGGRLSKLKLGREQSIEEEGGGEGVAKERRRLVKRKGTVSKSLSELEFEEVKGFMDLGFVFSEEDKDSRLAEIIPGLHRLGTSVAEEEGEVERQGRDMAVVPRPYLSESWEWWEQQRKDGERGQVLAQWEVPVSGDESDIKRNLRMWAHNVASTVR
ncbi:hypothetical protein MLD38_010091 [Melastoma candidum]|uniref:Uncharacterized protein n=1 Tax=Melastoma candidum TaxID=119954 RepID=A0ACB9R736_9MYRT|nr:hypothetical protein MLD38_010091 [Melastoma candidum]